MKKELFLFVFLSVFITLIDLGVQIRGAQTRYTVVNTGLNQPLDLYKIEENREIVKISWLRACQFLLAKFVAVFAVKQEIKWYWRSFLWLWYITCGFH